MINRKRQSVHVNVKIDYDKLAAAIVKANTAIEIEAENNAITTNNDHKICYFFKVVGQILTRKAKTEERMTTALFGFLCSLILKTVAVSGFLLFVLSIIFIFYYTFNVTWNGINEILLNIFIIIFLLLFVFMVFVISIMSLQSSREMEHFNDKNFILSVFSGLIALMAFIISIIAIWKS
ncbi:MAG: hypothetical protein LBJ12_06880 [Oscillospiraceae bacterium]|nr:hypothetical protein [Oscillospiraceae bacterium]